MVTIKAFQDVGKHNYGQVLLGGSRSEFFDANENIWVALLKSDLAIKMIILVL